MCACVCVRMYFFRSSSQRGGWSIFVSQQCKVGLTPSLPLCTPTSKVRGIKSKQGSSFPSASAPAAAPNERESECVSPEVAWKRGGDS